MNCPVSRKDAKKAKACPTVSFRWAQKISVNVNIQEILTVFPPFRLLYLHSFVFPCAPVGNIC